MKQAVRDFQPDIIFHFAAQPFVRTSYAKPILTWETNVIGTLNILSCLNEIDGDCTLIAVTTDKVYKNNEWIYGYRENDQLGGHDPYSASKAACEIAISSWRNSFVSGSERFKISSVRAGNVIGGGDFSPERLIPDCVKFIRKRKKIKIRNPKFNRPWQFVLEPLNGYLVLAKKQYENPSKFSQIHEHQRTSLKNNCELLQINAHPLKSMQINARQRTSMKINANGCKSMGINEHQRTYMKINEHHCNSVQINANQ